MAPDTGELWTSFVKWERILIVFLAAMAGIISPISSQIYIPALNSVAKDLGVSLAQVNLTLTTFLIFQGISPTFVSDIADNLGRRPAYLVAFVIYVIANLGLALQNSYAALLVLRCLQSAGSSGTIALAYAMVADIATAAQRGTYMGFTGAGILLGPALGPIFGGLLSQYLGWHSIFWTLLIFSSIMLIVLITFLPETGRNVVGNGSIPPPKWNTSVVSKLQERRKLKGLGDEERARVIEQDNRKRDELASKRKVGFPNPLRTLVCIKEKDIGLLLFNNSIIFTAFYCALASLPQVLRATYGFDDLLIGICFIPFGVGCGVASVVNGRIMDFNYRRVARQHGLTVDRRRGDDLRKFPIEKARLQCAIPMLYIGVLFFFAYGWLLQYAVHPAIPLVILFFIGMFITGSFSIGNTFLIDLYPKSSATATSANNLVRCLMGAGGTALINPMIAAMGLGWCFTFIAFVVLICSPLLFVILKKGPKWREERYVRWAKETEAKEAKEAGIKGTAADISTHARVVEQPGEQEVSEKDIEKDLEKGV